MPYTYDHSHQHSILLQVTIPPLWEGQKLYYKRCVGGEKGEGETLLLAWDQSTGPVSSLVFLKAHLWVSSVLPAVLEQVWECLLSVSIDRLYYI